jgi:copper(I)-binding protein
VRKKSLRGVVLRLTASLVCLAVALACVIALLALTLGAAEARQVKAGTLVLHHPWTRATVAGANVAAGYVVIENTGNAADRLLGASLEGAASGAIHIMKDADGVMTMRPVEGGVEIPPQGSVSLQPGGVHLMFSGLNHPLIEGQMAGGALIFEKAGRIALSFEVENLGSQGPSDGREGTERQ